MAEQSIEEFVMGTPEWLWGQEKPTEEPKEQKVEEPAPAVEVAS